jgi:uncharacterized MAPEG superfamily protein
MTTEIQWLLATLLLTTLLSVPYVANRIATRGSQGALSDPRGDSGGTMSAWAQRAFFAHENAVENVLIFGLAVLAAKTVGVSTPVTQIAAAVYFFARVAHYAFYIAGIGMARTMAHTVAWIAQILIILIVMGWV